MISVAHPKFRDELFQQAKEGRSAGQANAPWPRASRASIHGPWKKCARFDGVEVLFRPARPTDERQIQEHFYNLDRDDVMRRFLHERVSFARQGHARDVPRLTISTT